jgi:hypothetical protein
MILRPGPLIDGHYSISISALRGLADRLETYLLQLLVLLR